MSAVESQPGSAGCLQPSSDGMRINVGLNIGPVDFPDFEGWIIASHKAGPETKDSAVDIRTIKKKKKNNGACKGKHLCGLSIECQQHKHYDPGCKLNIRRTCSRITHSEKHEDDACKKNNL